VVKVGGYSFWFKGTAEVPPLETKAPEVVVQPPEVTVQPPEVEVRPPEVTVQPPEVTVQPQVIEKKEIPWWMWLLVIVLAGGLGLAVLKGD